MGSAGAKTFGFAKDRLDGQIPGGPKNSKESRAVCEGADFARKKKRAARRKTRTRGLALFEMVRCYVMVTLTVIAGLVTPPEEGVIVRVVVLVLGRLPVQPATTMKTSIAPTIPMRVRKRRAEGIMKSRVIASITRSSCSRVAAGGTFMDSGATTKEAAVSVPFAVAPGAAAALVVGTAHALTSALPGVHVKETAPVNPPSPVMVTGKVPMAPLATLALPADTEKSQAVPVSGTVCGLPLALSVTDTASLTVPGAVDD